MTLQSITLMHVAFLHREQGPKINWNQPNMLLDKECEGGTTASLAPSKSEKICLATLAGITFSKHLELCLNKEGRRCGFHRWNDTCCTKMHSDDKFFPRVKISTKGIDTYTHKHSITWSYSLQCAECLCVCVCVCVFAVPILGLILRCCVKTSNYTMLYAVRFVLSTHTQICSSVLVEKQQQVFQSGSQLTRTHTHTHTHTHTKSHKYLSQHGTEMERFRSNCVCIITNCRKLV